MTMPDTLHIILPQAVHANYIFRIMVVNGEQRSKLPLNSGLLKLTDTLLAHKSFLPDGLATKSTSFIILFAYIHFITPFFFQLQTDQILQHTCNQPVTIAHHGINQKKGRLQKYFFIRLQNFLSFNIIPGNTLNDKSTFQCIQIIIDGIHIHLPLLTFEVISYIFSVQLYCLYYRKQTSLPVRAIPHSGYCDAAPCHEE